MKKLIILFFAGCFLIFIASCGGNEGGKEAEKDSERMLKQATMKLLKKMTKLLMKRQLFPTMKTGNRTKLRK